MLGQKTDSCTCPNRASVPRPSAFVMVQCFHRRCETAVADVSTSSSIRIGNEAWRKRQRMNIAGQRRPACVTRLNCEFRGALVTVNRRWPPSVCFLQHTNTRQGSGTAHPAARLARRWDRDPQLRFNGGQCRRRRRPICRGHHGGFPVLRTSDRGESRLVFPFANGALYDEAVVFSERDIFRLLSDRIAQRCPFSQNAW